VCVFFNFGFVYANPSKLMYRKAGFVLGCRNADGETVKFMEGMDMLQRFDLLSLVRHTLVHNRQAISKGLLEYIEKNKVNKSRELFERQFERKNIDGRIQIFLTAAKASDVLTWLNSFAHLIFKSLSMEQNLLNSVGPKTAPVTDITC
jgi:hypothetical protein